MSTYFEEKNITIHEDENGNKTTDTKIQSREVKSSEPDYIKLYTKLWFDAKNIPDKYLKLFLALVCRMTYANPNSPSGGQIVYTVGHTGQAIMHECDWKTKDAFYKGLQALCDCNAIKKLGRGEYQINPEYAGKGPWRYNPKLDQGGIENIIATFNIKDKKVDTKIVWADDQKENDDNKFYRNMLDVNKNDNAMLLTSKETPEETPEETPKFITELEKDAKQPPVEQNKKKRGRPKKETA